MDTKAKLAITFSRGNSRAALTYALLLMISYGALVGTVHSHGYVPMRETSIAHFSSDADSQSSAGGYSHSRECSMCQFQRQLFDGFVHSTVFARQPSTEIAQVFSLTITYSSTSTTPTSGRAPPSL